MKIRPSPPRVAFYVSGHGFGHAVRSSALLQALRARAGSRIELYVRSDAPPWIFTEREPTAVCSSAPIDVGVRQPNGLDLDLEATLAAHAAFLRDWPGALERETAWLRRAGAALVVGDVPPLAFAAAERAGVPSVAVANFSWDWILDAYAEAEPGFRPIVSCYAAAYGTAERLFRLPLHGDFPAFREVADVPLLVHRSRTPPQRTRRRLGFDAGGPVRLVLVSFGGFGSGPLPRPEWDDLSGYGFVGFGPAPVGFPAPWVALPERGPLAHEDLVAASDVVIGKPGYGTCAEVLVHGTRFLHLPRERFREVGVLEAGLARHGCTQQMPREDFLGGRWRPHLDALCARTPQPTGLGGDGAEVIAAALLEHLG